MFGKTNIIGMISIFYGLKQHRYYDIIILLKYWLYYVGIL